MLLSSLGRICPLRFGKELLPEAEAFLPEAEQLCIGGRCAWWYGNVEGSCVLNMLMSCIESIDGAVADIDTILGYKMK